MIWKMQRRRTQQENGTAKEKAVNTNLVVEGTLYEVCNQCEKRVFEKTK
jgi:hypothetical protein